ncbi:transcriptional regulator, AraC family with amidase-like domain [Rhizobiales bacterium GAS188]|nr:transcriptional regulator, AraC family with amidase-like domain [Rhizobiales bacterium GAS188]
MIRSKPRRIVMLSYEGANLVDVCGPVQAFETARRHMQLQGLDAYETVVASETGGPVVTGAGLAILTRPVAELEAAAIDTLIVPGGSPGGEPVTPGALVGWVAAHAAAMRRVCSVCTGAFTLAAAGLLNGRRATTHWRWAELLARRHPSIRVEPDPIFIRDGSLWTSAGVTAGMDLALALIEEDVGHRVAIEVARDLVMFMKRPGGQSQFSVPLAAQTAGDALFGDLHAWMVTHLVEDLRVERLAERVGMSPRSFARLYAARVGNTPAKTVEMMRLEAARRALEETDLPTKRIAAELGYGDEQNLRRVFQRQLGIGPAQYRDRFSGHQVYGVAAPVT